MTLQLCTLELLINPGAADGEEDRSEPARNSLPVLGTGSRQILVTFYQVLTCQRFSLTPLQGVANLLSAQHARSPMATPQHGIAQLSRALLKAASPSEHPPPQLSPCSWHSYGSQRTC